MDKISGIGKQPQMPASKATAPKEAVSSVPQDKIELGKNIGEETKLFPFPGGHGPLCYLAIQTETPQPKETALIPTPPLCYMPMADTSPTETALCYLPVPDTPPWIPLTENPPETDKAMCYIPWPDPYPFPPFSNKPDEEVKPTCYLPVDPYPPDGSPDYPYDPQPLIAKDNLLNKVSKEVELPGNVLNKAKENLKKE